MAIERKIRPLLAGSRKSVLLLGARQTGKSTLIRSLQPQLEINLSDEEVFVAYLKDPGLLKREIGKAKTIFVDEIQRIPSLLNTIQYLIDGDRTLKFFLTGSSARRLRRGQANLLPGRIFTYQLGPLTPLELLDSSPTEPGFDVERALKRGLLPEPYLEESQQAAEKLLRSYSLTYLKEEVQAEALTRNLEGFSRFFEVCASRSGEFIDFTKFASQAMIERMSARRYFEILCDTLVVQATEPFSKSGKLRLVQHPRYFFFDVGVLNGILKNFVPSADRIGSLFEHLVAQALRSTADSMDQEIRISNYRTESGAEVDFVVEVGNSTFAIEVKASRNVGEHDLRGLKSFSQFFGRKCQAMVISLGEREQNWNGIDIVSLTTALERIFGAKR